MGCIFKVLVLKFGVTLPYKHSTTYLHVLFKIMNNNNRMSESQDRQETRCQKVKTDRKHDVRKSTDRIAWQLKRRLWFIDVICCV